MVCARWSEKPQENVRSVPSRPCGCSAENSTHSYVCRPNIEASFFTALLEARHFCLSPSGEKVPGCGHASCYGAFGKRLKPPAFQAGDHRFESDTRYQER